jgi:hypothetical protein
MKTSEKFIALLCDPDNKVCILGSDEDKRILQEAIQEVVDLEKVAMHTHSHIGKEDRDDSCATCNLDLRHPIHFSTPYKPKDK